MADVGARNNTASACETSHWLLRETLPRLLKRPPRRCEVCARILEAETQYNAGDVSNVFSCV